MDKGYKLSISSSSLNNALLSAENTMGGNMPVKTGFDYKLPDRFGILDKYGLEPGYYKLGLRYWKGDDAAFEKSAEEGSELFSFYDLKSDNKVTAISCTLYSTSGPDYIYRDEQYSATEILPSNIKVAGRDKFPQHTELLIQSIYGIATIVEKPVDRSSLTPTKFIYLIDNEEVEVTKEDLNNKDKLIKVLVGNNTIKFEKTFDVSAYCNLKEIYLPKTLKKIDIDFDSSVEDLSSISGTILTDGINVIFSGSESEYLDYYYNDPVDNSIKYQHKTVRTIRLKMTYLKQ